MRYNKEKGKRVFSLLGRGDYFGSRMLLSNSQWRKYRMQQSGADGRADRSSYLSVIADSAQVKVYVIKRGMLEFLPKSCKRDFLMRVKHFPDPDRPVDRHHLDQVKSSLKAWDQYKEKLTASILQGKHKDCLE